MFSAFGVVTLGGIGSSLSINLRDKPYAGILDGWVDSSGDSPVEYDSRTTWSFWYSYFR